MSCKMIRIGVFFDGTGNNLTNDQSIQQESNIAKLYQLYCKLYTEDIEPQYSPFFIGSKASECKIITTAIYIEGLGTEANQHNSMPGLIAGSGGAKRIVLAEQKIEQLRQRFPKEEYKCYIDVFGFSRGAALAREFINVMYRKAYDKERYFSFKFVGLFDTVASFGKAGDDKNYKPISADKGSEGWTFFPEVVGTTPSTSTYEPYNFNLSPNSAEKIVHLVALDEYREKFPLTNTNGAGNTYYFIGAHSDVGGGYTPETVEQLFEYSNQKDIAHALEQVNHPENGILIGENWKASYVDYQEVDPFYQGIKQIIKCKGVRYVSNDLQLVGLLTMYNLAVKAGVPFLPFTLDLSQTSLIGLTKEIAYTEYHPNSQIIDRYSTSITDLLGENSSWSEELKAYCIVAIENPSGLNAYLGHHTDFCYPNKENVKEKEVQHSRQQNHLKILAKYAHNSSCTKEIDGLNPPPIGFKHRQFSSLFTEQFSNNAFYAGTWYKPTPPVRIVFDNNSELAISTNDVEDR